MGLKNGDMVYTNTVEQKPVEAKSSIVRAAIKVHPIDDVLLKDPGTIKRSRNPQFCKHGDVGMCEYCLPLQPYDTNYLEENKIKHMSFHAYLKSLIDRGKIPPSYSPQFIPPLDTPTYKVLHPCPSQSHEPYPNGICSKCQPSAITLQVQNFRMVDHVEFESHAIVNNFLQFWRSTGTQRCGYLYGRIEVYDKVPLGVKVIVSAIYEPPQHAGHDSIQLLDEPDRAVDTISELLGLQRIGVIYSDLFDDGTGNGTVICKRHVDSYFLSSAEVIFSAGLQLEHPCKTRYSETGDFGSRFVTCVISGNEEKGIDIQTYQVSNAAMSMARDGIIEASTEPSLMRVCQTSNTNYVPDVFYKYKNEYNLMVQEAAKPTFPVEYLLVTSTHGFPSEENPMFNDQSNFIENRLGVMGNRNINQLKELATLTSAEARLRFLSDFHLLIFLKESEILDQESIALLCLAIKEKSVAHLNQLEQGGSWQTLNMIIQESAAAKGGASTGAGGAPMDHSWSCRHCTFHNDGGDACEMCGLPPDN
ncbi:NPL4 family-domain-containing protein [Globomyces pollinis-pini]|nr:NPL4 family-domain-containing protein [Globomyces pollinis-pini]